MNVRLLIDEIVRQTTVLIAQLSTATGLRAPLAHIADQVFLELARELELQGVRRKVAADMFGLALRSYQVKVRRLNDSADSAAVSLWQRLYADLSNGNATRSELEKRHGQSSAKQVAAAMQDMVQSGIAYSSGRGPDTLFGLTSEIDRGHISDAEQRRIQSDLCWYFVANGSANSRSALAAALRCDPASVDAALTDLLSDGCVTEVNGHLEATSFEVALGAERGWETSVFDHFRAVTTSIAAKVNRPVASHDDEIGGGTRNFVIYPEHPYAGQVYALLSETRRESRELWQQVTAYNKQVPPPKDSDRVTFYFGQNVVRGGNGASR
jgi:hypothetical protein